MEHRAFQIVSRVHNKTGLIVSYSDDLPGLLVTARTEEEMSRKLPGAIAELLEAHGLRVLKGGTRRRNELMPVEFSSPPSFVVDIVLAEVA